MKNKIFISHIIIFINTILAVDQVLLKACSRDNLLNCPNNSLCAHVNDNNNDTTLKCVCIENFQLNPNWLEYENSNSSLLLHEHYCVSSTEHENKLIVYMRSPARKDHLVFGILMVLLAAILATTVLYGLKLLRPLKRTKSVYHKLKNKRQNIAPMQEMDELELNRRYEMQML